MKGGMFGDSDSLELQRLARARKMAELLQQQGTTGIDPNRTAGGWVVPIGAGEGLSKLAQALSGAYMGNKLDEREKEVGERQRSERTATMEAFANALKGTPGRAAVEMPPEELGGGPGREAVAPVAGSPDAAYGVLAQSRDPMLQNAALAAQIKRAEEMAKPKAPIKLGKDDRLLDPSTFKPIVEPTPSQKYHNVGGNLVPEPTAPGQQVSPVYTAPQDQWGDPYTLNGQAVQKNSKTGEIRQAVRLPTQVNTNVAVHTDKNLYGDMAGAVGKDIAAVSQQARAAVSTINTVNAVRAAIDSGKVIAGPGTTQRMVLGQVGQVLGIAGKDSTEQLTATRAAIQGLAQLELDGAQQMRGQGQITEAERAIVRRAASGDIDGMTVPELSVLMGTLDKTARSKLRQNQSNVDALKRQPQAGSMPQFMEVPEPAPYGNPRAPARAGERRGGDAPAGIDKKIWDAMTEQERALWRK